MQTDPCLKECSTLAHVGSSSRPIRGLDILAFIHDHRGVFQIIVVLAVVAKEIANATKCRLGVGTQIHRWKQPMEGCWQECADRSAITSFNVVPAHKYIMAALEDPEFVGTHLEWVSCSSRSAFVSI